MLRKHFFAFAFAISLTALLPGCGGGGGGTAPSVSQAPGAMNPANVQSGSGKVAAVVKLSGGASRAASTASSVNVTVTITGIYSANGKEFEPVTTTYPVNLAQGYARVSLTEVPTGVNHLLTATADWGGGVVETVKAIIPAVEKDEITNVTADQASTAVAAAAVAYASQKGVSLSAVDAESIESISAAVAAYSSQASYSSMTADNILKYMAAMGVPASVSLTPAAASLMIGETLQLSAVVLDGNGSAVASASVTWSAQTSAGTLSSSGLFTASSEGSAVITALYNSLSATASVTVVKVCTAASECNDGNALTIDACSNPGTLSAACTHTAIACNTVADCDDGNALTIDACTNGGTASAACGNTAFACNDALDCDDSNALTIDTCTGGGTASASCGHAAFACNTVADCDDANALTTDTCTDGGTILAVCGHSAYACNTDADCDDADPLTGDFCMNGGGAQSSCTNIRGYTKITAGSNHMCEVMPDTTVQCWGNNGNGQVGNGAPITQQILARKAGRAGARDEKPGSAGRSASYVWGLGTENFVLEPATVVGITGAIQVTAGDWHSCALLNTGAIKCWGSNNEWTLGDGTNVDSSTPVDVIGITDAVMISTSNDHTCALLAGGTVKCWGWGYDGQLGDGNMIESGVPVDVVGITGAVQVSAGGWDTCAVLADGTIKCWGGGVSGALGDGLMTSSPTPVDVVGITNAVYVSAGADQTCALLSDATVKCWGSNMSGELGDGTGIDSGVPVDVPGITNAISVSAGSNHSCAVLADGTAQCWGRNMDGELGNSGGLTQMNYSELSPLPVIEITGTITSVSAAVRGAYTCFTLADGSFECAGSNRSGQFGDGRSYYTTTPISEFGLSSLSGFDIAGTHACAALSDGTLTCYGQNGALGLLGDGRDVGWREPITGVAGITNAAGYAAGDQHSCALTASQTVTCWGQNMYGQLGLADSQYLDSMWPQNVPGLTGVTTLTAGGQFTCALMSGGTIKCWGYGLGGQLGDGLSSTSDIPVDVSGITSAVDISAGLYSTCALLADSTLQCWGDNASGQLGDGNLATWATTPVAVSDGLGGSLTGVTAVTVGGNHTCALMSDGTIKCWGDNAHGQLGDGNTGTSSAYPLDVAGITGAVSVAAGDGYTCAALATGGVKCWGYNANFTLGNGDITGVDQPNAVDVPGITDATNVFASTYRTCAMSASRGLLCWGNDLYYIGR